jgi:NAD(P)H dehydrogenase (quinone)
MQNVLGQAASIKTDSRMVLPFAKDLPVALIDVRHRRCRRARPDRPGAACGQDLRVHRQTHDLRRLRRGVLAGARSANRLCRHHARAGRAGHESARHAGLAGGASRHQRQARRGRAFSTENIELIEDLVGRAPITTKQFVEDFKAVFS